MKTKLSKKLLNKIFRKLLPGHVYQRVVRKQNWRQLLPPSGRVIPDSPDRLQPISREFGFDRGRCIDRYYIESFLHENRRYIRGKILEAGDRNYTQQFGGNAVASSDVLHAVPGNPFATIVGDVADSRTIPASSFDCIILTQTLHLVYDIRAALRHVHAALKNNGVLLASIPGISQISRWDMDRWGDCWRLTSLSAKKLFCECFSPGSITIHAHGNVFVASSFLYGLAAEELSREELDYFDPDYEVLLTICAIKTEHE